MSPDRAVQHTTAIAVPVPALTVAYASDTDIADNQRRRCRQNADLRQDPDGEDDHPRG